MTIRQYGNKWKLVLSVLIFASVIGGFIFSRFGEYIKTRYLSSDISYLYIDGFTEPLSYKFLTNPVQRIFYKDDIGTIRFEVRLPSGFENYFNTGESPNLVHMLNLLSPSLQSFNYTYERDLLMYPSTSYIVELSDFMPNYDVFYANPGNWHFSFQLVDKSGVPIDPKISQMFTIQTYPVRIDTSEISDGYRLFWETSNVAQNQVSADEENFGSAFTKEISIHILTDEIPRSAEDFPIGSSRQVFVDSDQLSSGNVKLFLDKSRIHTLLMTINSTLGNTGTKYFLSNLKVLEPVGGTSEQVLPSTPVEDNSSDQPVTGSTSPSLADLMTLARLQDEAQNFVQDTAASDETTQISTNFSNTSSTQSEIPSVSISNSNSNSNSSNVPVVDFNFDNKFDSEDVLILSNYINLSGNWSTFVSQIRSLGISFSMTQVQFINAADINKDGNIDISDLNILYLKR